MLRSLINRDWKRRVYLARLAIQRTWRTKVSQPWRRPHLEVYAVPSGLGDEIMAVGVAQAAARANDGLRVTYYTRYSEIFTGAPGLAEVCALPKSGPPASALGLTYAPKHSLPVMSQMGTYLGLPLTSFDIHLPRRQPEEAPLACRQSQPLVTIQTTASNWTPNKQWPESHWRAFVEGLPPDCTVVELGTHSIFLKPPQHPRYQALLGKTTLPEYAAAIQASSVFVGPVSAGMHLAHGYGVPSVIILGGYELPHPYPLAEQFYHELPCSPCWLRDACPLDRKCLQEIAPTEVLRATLKALERSSPSQPPHPA